MTRFIGTKALKFIYKLFNFKNCSGFPITLFPWATCNSSCLLSFFLSFQFLSRDPWFKPLSYSPLYQQSLELQERFLLLFPPFIFYPIFHISFWGCRFLFFFRFLISKFLAPLLKFHSTYGEFDSQFEPYPYFL